jgi:hypothetical protein
VQRVVGAVVERDPPRADRWANVADVAARLPQFVDGALGGDPDVRSLEDLGAARDRRTFDGGDQRLLGAVVA